MFVFSTHAHVISGHSKATSLQSLPGLARMSTLWLPLTATEENIAQWSPVFAHTSSQNNGSMGNYIREKIKKESQKCAVIKLLHYLKAA